jgi:TatD DNase family protein
MFVDVHTHNSVLSKGFSILNLSIKDAENKLNSNEKGTYSVGLHPWDIDEFSNEHLDILAKIGTDRRILAIGECGLDNNINISIEKQILFFERQIEISEQLQKPLIIHCVGCYNQLFEIKKRKKVKQKWIIHGFRGKPQLAIQAMKLNCGLSFGEFFNEETIKITSIENLFVETDVSNLTIGEVYENIATAKNCNPTDLTAGKLLFF